MLTLYTSTGAVPLRCDDYYIRELASGLDELNFSMSIYDPAYSSIQEEASIREESGPTPINYLVKAIDGGKETASIKCQIDLDAWKTTMTHGYDSGSLTVGAIVRAVAPGDWTVSDQSGLSYSRTIHLDNATPLDVLEQCRSTFNGVSFRWDNVTKTVTIVNMTTGTNMGAFVTRDLNLRQNTYKGKSTGFITRLYAYGKDGMTFSSINGGKAYVDNNTYSNRVICGVWKDDRYTIPANLLQDAQDRLATLAVPSRSYDCDVVDLAAIDPARYSYLSFPLYSVVTLIDTTRSNAKIDHTVVELWRYPYLPQKNKVVLSTSAPRIQSQVAQIVNSMTNSNSIYQQQQTSAIQSAVDNATAHITGAEGGYVRAIYDANQNWTELVVMNTNDITTASKLWRFNLGGLGYSPYGYNGPYTTAITMDGAIVADFITTGTLSASVIAANSISVSKLTGNITNGNWKIDLDAGTFTIGNISAGNITTGTLSADRLAANSIGVAKLTGTIQNSGWKLDLNAGTFTIGTLSADNINGGTINASTINVTNLNASNLTTGTLPSDRVGSQSITGGKLANSTITVTQIANGAVTGAKVDYQTLTDSNYARYSVSGGSGGAVGGSTLSSYNIDSYIGGGVAGGVTANDVFAGNTQASWLKANYIQAATSLWFQGRQVVWSILPIGGNTYYVLTG